MAGKITTVTADVIVELGKRGLDSFFEWLEEEDEEFDGEKFLQYFIALASVWGHAAQSDDEISEEEEDFLGQMIEEWFTQTDEDDFYISPEILEAIGVRKKEMKKMMLDAFHKPMILKDICRFADEHEEEENFYFQACLVVLCDDNLREEEDQFLMEFASKLELSKIDRKRLFQEATNFFAELNEEEEEE